MIGWADYVRIRAKPRGDLRHVVLGPEPASDFNRRIGGQREQTFELHLRIHNSKK